MYETLIQMIFRFKAYLIGGAIVIVIAGGSLWWYDTKTTEYYNNGFAAADAKWEKLSEEQSAKNNQLFIDNTILNQKLKETQDQLREEQAKKKADVDQKVTEFQKTPEASTKLSDGFINIYNESLGE